MKVSQYYTKKLSEIRWGRSFYALRHIAIMNTRYNKNLQDAWREMEENLKRK